MSNTVVTIGAPSGQTQVSVSSADIIYVTVAAGFTGQGGDGSSNTNLSTTRTATTVTVVSDTGTDATIAAADGSNAGVMTAAMKTKLDGIEAGAEVNDSASEILTKLLTVDGSGSGLDADTLDGVHASALVPYTGATGDVNLGEWGIQLGNLEFDNTPTNTPATDGSVFWDSGDGTLQFQMKGGATQKVGMNTFARVYNDSGVQLVKGDVVYISGAQGNRIAAKKAQANTESTAKNTFAIVVETIAAGSEGTVITEGPLYNLNTFGLTAGATLYLSPTTAGAYTETQPQAPDHLVIIGFVERVHATVGSVYVRTTNGFELEELHDVDLTESKATPVDADALLLQDSADSSIWKRLTWANLKATAKSYFDTLYAAVVHTHAIGDVTNLQTSLDGKVDENAAITGATKTKITYDAKGLVTAGEDAAIADITGLQTALDAKAALAGATFTGGVVTPASTTAGAGFRIPHGTAPTAPTNGDVWTTTTGLFMRQNGVNKQYVDFDTSQTIDGNKTFSNANGTFGSSTATSTYNIASGATISGATKTLNVGTGGVAGSTTNVNIGSPNGTSTTTLQGTTNGVTQAAATNNLTLATTAFVRQEINGQAVFTSTTNGLAPLSGGGTTNFLRADGTWAAPSGGGGGGGTAVTLNQKFTQVGPVNSTTETAIFSYTLPTNLVAGDTLQLNLAGLFKNNSGASRTVDMYFKLGATTVMSHSISLAANAAERTGSMLLNLFIVATNSQKMSVTSWSPDAAPGAMGAIQTGSRFFNSLGYGTAAEDLTSAKTLQVTVRFLTASADLYCYSQAATLVKFPKP